MLAVYLNLKWWALRLWHEYFTLQNQCNYTLILPLLQTVWQYCYLWRKIQISIFYQKQETNKINDSEKFDVIPFSSSLNFPHAINRLRYAWLFMFSIRKSNDRCCNWIIPHYDYDSNAILGWNGWKLFFGPMQKKCIRIFIPMAHHYYNMCGNMLRFYEMRQKIPLFSIPTVTFHKPVFWFKSQLFFDQASFANTVVLKELAMPIIKHFS